MKRSRKARAARKTRLTGTDGRTYVRRFRANPDGAPPRVNVAAARERPSWGETFEEKLAHAVYMAQRWERKLRMGQTYLRKWKRTAVRLERRKRKAGA